MKRHPIYLVATIAAILMLPLNASAYRFAECHFKDPSTKIKFYCCKRGDKHQWVQRSGRTSHENQKIACGLTLIPTSSGCGKHSHVSLYAPPSNLKKYCKNNSGNSTFVTVKYYEKSSWSAK